MIFGIVTLRGWGQGTEWARNIGSVRYLQCGWWLVGVQFHRNEQIHK